MHLFTVKPHDVFKFMLVCSLIKQDLTCKFDFNWNFSMSLDIARLLSRSFPGSVLRRDALISFLSYDTDSDFVFIF